MTDYPEHIKRRAVGLLNAKAAELKQNRTTNGWPIVNYEDVICDLLMKHEPDPDVDPDVLLVEELLATYTEAQNYRIIPDELRDGHCRDNREVRATVAKFKEWKARNGQQNQ